MGARILDALRNSHRSIERRAQQCVYRIVDRRWDAQLTTKADDSPVEGIQFEGIPIRDVTLHRRGRRRLEIFEYRYC
jgi:hypothetical protein